MNTPIPWPTSLSGNHLRATYPNFVQFYEKDMKPVNKQSVVTLREVTKDTVRRVSLLDVGPGQDGLVAPNAFSIAQAHFHPEAWFRAIYADDEPVGFAMLEDWTQVPDTPPQLWRDAPYVGLWRFMVDQRYQQLGFGAKALELLIAHARSRTAATTSSQSRPDTPMVVISGRTSADRGVRRWLPCIRRARHRAGSPCAAGGPPNRRASRCGSARDDRRR